VGRADVAVGHSGGPEVGRAAAGVLNAPAHVRLPVLDIERWNFLEVRDRHSRELVTVIELLSPSNKRSGSNRDQYLARREGLLGSRAHLVEIDLLRGGRPMPSEDRPDCSYSVLVSRVQERPRAAFWPITLRDRLPRIPIPLHPSDGEVPLDLQEILDRVHDASGYEDYIYDGGPEPPLTPEEAAWASPFVRRAQVG
jgi:hypothetical protein